MRFSTRLMLLATLLLVAVAVALYVLPFGRQDAPVAPSRTAEIVLQSGARGLYPSNTLPAIEGALALGVTRLELDLAMTRDDLLVLHHDLRLDPERTRGADGQWISDPVPLMALLADDLTQYDVGRPRPGGRIAAVYPEQRAIDGARILRLNAAVAFAERQSDGKALYTLDIKRSPALPALAPDQDTAVEALARSLTTLNLAERTWVQSFDWGFLVALQERLPELTTIYLTSEQPEFDTVRRESDEPSPWLGGLHPDRVEGSLPRLVADAGGKIWAPDYRDLRPVDLKEAHDLGLKVLVWTVNDPVIMASLLDMGVDGIVTDYPDRLRALLEERRLTLPPAYPPQN